MSDSGFSGIKRAGNGRYYIDRPRGPAFQGLGGFGTAEEAALAVARANRGAGGRAASGPEETLECALSPALLTSVPSTATEW